MTPGALDEVLPETRRRLIVHYLLRKKDFLHVSALAGYFNAGKGNIPRELAKLERMCLLRATKRGREKVFRPVPHPSWGAFAVLARFHEDPVLILREALCVVTGLDGAFLRRPAGTPTGMTAELWLVVVGHGMRISSLEKALRNACALLGRPLGYTVYPRRALATLAEPDESTLAGELADLDRWITEPIISDADLQELIKSRNEVAGLEAALNGQ